MTTLNEIKAQITQALVQAQNIVLASPELPNYAQAASLLIEEYKNSVIKLQLLHLLTTNNFSITEIHFIEAVDMKISKSVEALLTSILSSPLNKNDLNYQINKMYQEKINAEIIDYVQKQQHFFYDELERPLMSNAQAALRTKLKHSYQQSLTETPNEAGVYCSVYPTRCFNLLTLAKKRKRTNDN